MQTRPGACVLLDRREVSRTYPLLLVLLSVATRGFAGELDAASARSPIWCEPDGPKFTKQLTSDNIGSLKSGWVTIEMHVHPGRVPVTDVRVVSEAGGSALAREWLPLVRQWVGCAANQRDTLLQIKFTLGTLGNYQLPAKEGFGPLAFMKPRGAPTLPAGDIGVGVCPIRATLQLRQPEAKNAVIELESQGGDAVSGWLEKLVPDRDYMRPGTKGNRIDFDCKVSNGVISFYDN